MRKKILGTYVIKRLVVRLNEKFLALNQQRTNSLIYTLGAGWGESTQRGTQIIHKRPRRKKLDLNIKAV